MKPFRTLLSASVVAALLSCLLVGRGSAAQLLTGHTDIRFAYNPASATWDALLRHGGSVDNPSNQSATEQAALPARDLLFPGGERLLRTTNPDFNFTGVAAGAPLWILPQTANNYTWPGFRSDQTPGTFAPYQPADSRVQVAERWLKIQLQSVHYSGLSQTAHFSLWQIVNGAPLVWMATSPEGPATEDAFYLLENAHTHLNWGFSALGIYRITFSASAVRASDNTTITSGNHAVTFAIGTFATWRATHFAGPALVDDALTGPHSDPDQDGVKTLVEYAFNLLPAVPDGKTLTIGNGTSGLPVARTQSALGGERLVLEFIRRKSGTNPQIVYTPEFTGHPASGTWVAATPLTAQSIDGTWERVTVADPEPLSAHPARFGRVRITLQPTIPY